MIKYLLFCWYVILFFSCNGEERPSYATRELIFPDYRDVTIPVNIAPLSFYVCRKWIKMSGYYYVRKPVSWSVRVKRFVSPHMNGEN